MAARAIGERLDALDLAEPRIDAAVIEDALREHLALLGAPSVSFTLVGDAESAFLEAAKMVRRGWQAAAAPGPRWTRRSSWGGFRESLSLWESRSYWRSGGTSWPRLDFEVAGAARRSALHWRRSRRRVSGIEVPNPVTAAQVALRAAWDETTAARAEPEPPAPGHFDSSATWEQKAAFWDRYDRWRKWFDSDDRQAAARLEPAEPLVQAVEAGLFAFFWLRRSCGRSHACLAVPRPRMHVVSTGRGNSVELHAWDEPAVHWPDGPGYWYWHDIRIWRELIDHPSRLTAAYIARTRNVERRRVLLDRLGYERFLESANAELVQQDDYGKLWHTEIRLDGEAVRVVEVLNSTADPDGSYRRYFLRVPPRIRSARTAVAWTFGFDRPGDYRLAAQS